MPPHLLSVQSIDPDAQAYIVRAGVTNSGAKAQINAFVRGCKGLGIWNFMCCWPLISTQNAGSGTVVFALGGYSGVISGTYDGTISGSPTQSSSGLIFAGGGAVVTAPIKYNDYLSSTYCVAQSTTAGGIQIAMINGAPADGLNNMSYAGHIYNDANACYSSQNAGWGTGASAPLSQFNAYGWNQTSSTVATGWVNGTATSQGGSASNPASATNITSIGAAYSNGVYPWMGNIAFSAIFIGFVVKYAQLTSLYKSTLGPTLGLP